jgi:hypothetical protein
MARSRTTCPDFPSGGMGFPFSLNSTPPAFLEALEVPPKTLFCETNPSAADKEINGTHLRRMD